MKQALLISMGFALGATGVAIVAFFLSNCNNCSQSGVVLFSKNSQDISLIADSHATPTVLNFRFKERQSGGAFPLCFKNEHGETINVQEISKKGNEWVFSLDYKSSSLIILESGSVGYDMPLDVDVLSFKIKDILLRLNQGKHPPENPRQP